MAFSVVDVIGSSDIERLLEFGYTAVISTTVHSRTAFMPQTFKNIFIKDPKHEEDSGFLRSKPLEQYYQDGWPIIIY